MYVYVCIYIYICMFVYMYMCIHMNGPYANWVLFFFLHVSSSSPRTLETNRPSSGKCESWHTSDSPADRQRDAQLMHDQQPPAEPALPPPNLLNRFNVYINISPKGFFLLRLFFTSPAESGVFFLIGGFSTRGGSLLGLYLAPSSLRYISNTHAYNVDS